MVPQIARITERLSAESEGGRMSKNTLNNLNNL